MKRLLSIAVAAASENLSLSALAEQLMEHAIVSVSIHKQEADAALPITIITGMNDSARRLAPLAKSSAIEPVSPTPPMAQVLVDQ